MERRWFVLIFSSILSLYIHIATAAIPNLSTLDNYRVVVSAKNKRSYATDDIFNDEVNVAPIKVTHMRVRSEISLRYARTTIISKVQNPSNNAQETTFQVLLPDTAFISGFTMTIGNETYQAFVKEKEDAKITYEDAKSQGLSAAHIAIKARDSKHFISNINIEKKSKATCILRYEEFLVPRNGLYNHAINLIPGGLVPTLEVVVHIKESQKITQLRVPELRTGNEIDATEDDPQNTKADIRRSKNDNEAIITFAPDLAEQTRLAEIQATKKKQSDDIYSSYIGYDSEEEDDENESFLGQFVVQYSVDKPKDGEILVNDGYFVHFFAPYSLPPLSKYVVFVLDTSGSMTGNKIDQLRKAMTAILNDLHERDYFSIIEFNSDVKVHDIKKSSKPEEGPNHRPSSPSLAPPSPVTSQTITAAVNLVSKLKAYGGTNIYKALYTAMNLIQKGVDNEGLEDDGYELESIVIFLTDGEPTVGETDPERIISKITEDNSGTKRAPLLSLAFGSDADRVFLRKLSLRNEGFMRNIYEAADAALQLHDFYRQVSSPMLANVTFTYPTQEVKKGSVSRSHFRIINEGSEVAVVGKIAKDISEITCRIYGIKGDADGRGRKIYETNYKVAVSRGNKDFLPLERLWAYLTIKQLLDKRDSEDDNTNTEISYKDSLERKALAIALQFAFVTPLTSLVLVRQNKTYGDDDDETFDEPSFLPHRSISSSPIASPHIDIQIEEDIKVVSSRGPPILLQTNSRVVLGNRPIFRKRDEDIIEPASAISHHQSPGHIEGLSGYSGGAGGGGASGAKILAAFGNAASLSGGSGGFGGSGGSGGYNHDGGHVRKRPSPESHKLYSDIHGGRIDTILGYSNDGGGDIYHTVVPPSASSTTVRNVANVWNNDEGDDYKIGGEYHLEGYEWTSSLLDNSTDTLVFKQNEDQIILKLTKRIIPPKEKGGDKECLSKTTLVTESARTICVYITRCLAARNITIDDYQKSYCHIKHRYAGVCCPENEVDRIP